MFLSQELVFSEGRQSWNLFVNGEWYFEGTYEQCSDMMFNNAVDDAPDEVELLDYEGDDYPDFLDEYEEPEQDASILYGAPEDAGAFGGGKY